MAKDDRAFFAAGRLRAALRPLWRLALPVFVALVLPTLVAEPARAAPVDDVRIELAQASADLVNKQALYRDAQRGEKSAASGDFATLRDAIHAPALDLMCAQALELGRRESELSATYGPAYPARVEVLARRLRLAADIRAEVKRLIGAMRVDFEVAREREAALEGSLADLREETKSAASDHPPSIAALVSAVAPVDTDAAVAPRPPRGAGFLNDFLVVSVAVALLGLFIGLAFTVWRDVRSRLTGAHKADVAVPEIPPSFEETPLPAAAPEAPPFPAPESLREAFILGRFPDVGDAGDDIAMLVVDDPQSDFAQEIERLAARLVPTSEGGHVVSLFPLQAGQGTTNLMICLSEAVARNGFKVLLIDADVEDRGMSRTLHAAGMRGLGEVLAGLVPASKLVLDQNGVTILPSGRLPVDLRASAETMAGLLAETRRQFDLILIDAAPFDPQRGSTTLCRLSDDFGLVACREDLPRARFVASVEAAAAFQSFAGIILNREPVEALLVAVAS